MTELTVKNISVKAGQSALINDVSFTLRPGELVALLGPNGAGKTTALRASLGLTDITNGEARLGGHSTAGLPASARARLLSYLPQIRPLAWPNRVTDIVALGRFSHGAAMGRLKGADKHAVETAMSACGIAHLAARKADSLSGGELARVHFARAIAAGSPLLIADEPVAALDPQHQFRVMDLIQTYVKDGGGALVVLHDVALAAKYADRLIFMKDGHVVSDGAVADTLSAKSLAEIYGVRAAVNGRAVTLLGNIEPSSVKPEHP